MGFVFQIYNLLPVLSAVENVELPLLVSGGRPKQARQRALAALAAVGLVDWAGHRPAALSGGQRQRVAVARALVNDPAIVWADEPTGALDSAAAAEVLDLIRLLNRRDGLTVVIVTHDPAIGELCDRIVQMRDGRIVGESGSRGVGASGSQESGDLGSNGVGDGTHRPADPARRHAELVEASRQSPYPSPEILRFAQDDDRGGDAAPRLLDASPSRPRYSPTSRLPDSPTRRQ
jgi:putative ABC transport system ATP-binding protein